LIRQLESGQRCKAMLMDNGKEQMVFIEANPRMRTVDFFDRNSEKLAVLMATTKKEGEKQGVELAKTFKVQQSQGRKKGQRHKLSIT